MTWVKMDDHFHSHPKLALLGQLQLPCVGLHVLAICWSAQYLTDGFVPAAQPAKLAGGNEKDLVNALVAVGLWHEVDGGWQIHDYLDYQPSKAQVERDRAIKVAAGLAGGQASAKARRQASAQAHAQAKSNPVPVPVPVPVPGSDPESEPATAKAAAAEQLPQIFRLFEDLCGTISPSIADELLAAESDYPAAWIEAAFKEAAVNNVRKWKYVKAILERWREEGFPSTQPEDDGYEPAVDLDAAIQLRAAQLRGKV